MVVFTFGTILAPLLGIHLVHPEIYHTTCRAVECMMGLEKNAVSIKSKARIKKGVLGNSLEPLLFLFRAFLRDIQPFNGIVDGTLQLGLVGRFKFVRKFIISERVTEIIRAHFWRLCEQLRLHPQLKRRGRVSIILIAARFASHLCISQPHQQSVGKMALIVGDDGSMRSRSSISSIGRSA